MKNLSVILILFATVLGGCTARNVTTFILATPCEAALAGSGNICQELLETMIELSIMFPPDSRESDDQIGPDYDDSQTDCSVTKSNYRAFKTNQIGGVVNPSTKQNLYCNPI